MAQTWVQHALARTSWRPQNQVVTLGLLAVLITLVFAGIYLSQVANFAILNRDTQRLIEQRDQLERRNEELRGQIAELETVPRLLERARGLGFRLAEARDLEYLVVDGYNPNRAITAAPLATQEAVTVLPVYDETFGGWLEMQWALLRQQFESFGQ
jgi:cell division protein FtsL